jgi:putative glutamine amidotransferase
VIAITALKPRDMDRGRVPVDYVAALERAGGDPYVLSTYALCDDEQPRADLDVLSGLDPDDTSVLDGAAGLVLSGGGDVDPASYGEDPHPRTYNVSPRRDRFEFNLLDVALARDMPVLAICRGMQLLNVHLGGTLEQHLLDTAGRLEHYRDRPRADVAHEVRVAPGTDLAECIGERAPVNSHHHQGIARLSSELEEIAHAEDGVLEGVVGREHSWVLGVQWHPEAMAAVDKRQLEVFAAFLGAATRFSAASRPARSA